jgi:hypothetical protein
MAASLGAGHDGGERSLEGRAATLGLLGLAQIAKCAAGFRWASSGDGREKRRGICATRYLEVLAP